MNFSDILESTIYSIIIDKVKQNKEFSNYLIVELLENEKIHGIDVVKERLQELKSFGVKIAVDDFGSGYSNYDIFKSLDIDILKIDGSIIKDIDNSKISYEIAKSIISLAKELNLSCVAEFVHSKEVYEVVKSLDIDFSQGFYLSKPLDKI